MSPKINRNAFVVAGVVDAGFREGSIVSAANFAFVFSLLVVMVIFLLFGENNASTLFTRSLFIFDTTSLWKFFFLALMLVAGTVE